METALTEITLVLFTTIAPAGVVGYLIMGIAMFSGRDDVRARRIGRYLVVPLAFVITGLIASATHLGTPANALYVATGIGRSPLSNEVAAAVAFLALGGVFWFLSFREDISVLFKKCWLTITLFAGIALILFISLAYSVDTVPTWNLPITPATLWAAAVASGPLVGLLGLCASRVGISSAFVRACLAIVLLAGIAGAVLLGWEYVELADIATTANSARDLVPWFPAVIAIFLLCDVFAVLCMAIAWCENTRRARRRGVDAQAVATLRSIARGGDWRKMLALNALSVAVSLFGCFAARFVFYAMHMTSGV